MKLGIVGLAQAGKTTLFTALSGEEPGPDAAAGRSVTKVVRVPDARLERLREVFRPRSFKPATFEATDFGPGVSREARLAAERESDALLVVLNGHSGGPAKDLEELDTEWTLADLQIAEKRVEKLRAQVKKPTPKEEKERDQLELAVLERGAAELGAGRPLSGLALEPRERAAIRHYGFMTQKPRLLVENVAETALGGPPKVAGTLAIAGKLEAELALMPEEERATFLAEYGIAEPARVKLLQAAFRLLGYVAFFTVGEDEVRAWPVPAGVKAPQAAGAVHTDIERGFIRAEVVSFEDFAAAGATMKAAKARNAVRLEGKEYVVRDGDIIEFRFAV